MELRIKKRIVGFLLLIALGLILVPLFFGRSITSDELTLSSHVPNRPEKPSDFAMTIPEKEATIAEVPTKPFPQSTEAKPKSLKPEASAAAAPPSRILFEPLSSTTEPDKSTQPTSIVADDKPEEASQPTSVPLPESVPPDFPSPTATTSATTTSSKQKEPTTPVAKPAPIPSAVTPTTKKIEIVATPESWVVQVGSFSDKTNANALMKKIQAAGFPAYVETSKTSKGTAVRVLVGPELQKSAANAMQATLAKSLNITGIVVKVAR